MHRPALGRLEGPGGGLMLSEPDLKGCFGRRREVSFTEGIYPFSADSTLNSASSSSKSAIALTFYSEAQEVPSRLVTARKEEETEFARDYPHWGGPWGLENDLLFLEAAPKL